MLGLILLKNADVTQLLTALKPLASDQNLIQAYPNAKAIVIIDKPAIIRRIGELARQMDKATPSSRVQVLRLTYADSDKLAPVLQQVMSKSLQYPAKKSIIR